MKISFSKQSLKDLAKLDKKIEKAFYKKLRIFTENKKDLSLNLHALKGEYLGKFSFNVTGDFRCIVVFLGDDLVVVNRISSHSNLY
jgi:mRNA-degrading endonuclease YafQ of YafQ-DinJ toxin-antitoxin module